MPWSKLDDGFHENAKTSAMSDKAFRLYVCAITYTSRHRLSGRLSPAHLNVLFKLTGAKIRHAQELASLFAWDEDGNDYVIHAYREYNPSPEEISRKRAEAGKRGAESRWQNGKPMANTSNPDGKHEWQTDGKGNPAQTRVGSPIPDPVPIPKGKKASSSPSASARLWPYEEPPASNGPMHALWKIESVGGIIAPTETHLVRELAAIKRHLASGSEEQVVKFFTYRLGKDPDWAAPSKWSSDFAVSLAKHKASQTGALETTKNGTRSSSLDEMIAEEMAGIERRNGIDKSNPG